MEIQKSEFEQLLDSMNLNFFPKTVGNPSQYMVHSFDELWDFFVKFNGEKSLYLCHNSFQNLKNTMGKEIPTKIQINNIFFDYDSTKMENAQLDTIRLSEMLTKLNISHSIDFSAGRGFHVLINIEPAIFDFSNDVNRNNLSNLIYAIQETCRKQTESRTMDEKSMKDVRKIMRMPYSYHFNKSGNFTNRICVPLDKKMIKWNITKIMQFSEKPYFFIPEQFGKKYSLEDLCCVLNVDFNEIKEKQKSQFAEISNINVNGKNAKMFLDLVERNKPCISNGMKTLNPNHFIRVAFAMYCKKMRMSSQQFKEVYYNIADELNYVDAHNREYGCHQIDTIFDNPRYTSEPSCTKIKQNGFCLGGCDKCHGKEGVCEHGKCLRYRK